MRTTLTLDDDVAAMLERERNKTGKGLKELVNDFLRASLERQFLEERAPTPVRIRTVDLGACLIGELDCVSDALALGEGEDHK